MGKVIAESELWADLERMLERTLQSVEPLGVLRTDVGRIMHRARASMHVAFGVITNFLTAAAADPELQPEAIARCLSVLRWTRTCNEPIVEEMRGQSLERLQRFAEGLGICHDGLEQPQLFGVIETYFKAHAKAPRSAS
jgi:hypothetical protein